MFLTESAQATVCLQPILWRCPLFQTVMPKITLVRSALRDEGGGRNEREREMDIDIQNKRTTWNMLNLCIGSMLEVMANKSEFSTADVARMLLTHGVDVTDWPEHVKLHPGELQTITKH